MATHIEPVDTTPPMNTIELSRLCQDLFFSFARSDQRRWGETYVRGLAFVSGRKSIRRISEQVVGWRADQCLQQFVNQSPWAWEPVRSRLAQQIAAAIRPKAWVIQETVFPKNGMNSVGVAKQFSYSAGRLLNCQLGLAVFMAGEAGSCPVNWRLLLPRCWDNDTVRRSRTHLPDNEQHRTRWQHLLNAVDEMVVDWGLVPAPIIVDAHQQPQVEPLLVGLEERGLRYVVQVAAHTPALPAGTKPPSSATPTVGEVAAQSARRSGMTVSQRDTLGRLTRSQFVAAPLPRSAAPYDISSGRPYRGLRRVVAEWSPTRRSPKAVWLTNLNTPRLPDLIGVIAMRQRTDEDLARLSDESGLRHFEGRSFRGWHHHVTLVSVAHAYGLLAQLEEQRAPDLPLPAYR